jgi:hypothetical protein
VTAIDCCVDSYGCMVGAKLYFSSGSSKDVACPSGGGGASCSGNSTRVTLDGENVVSYDVEVKKWGAGGALQRCVSALLFQTPSRILRCGAPRARRRRGLLADEGGGGGGGAPAELRGGGGLDPLAGEPGGTGGRRQLLNAPIPTRAKPLTPLCLKSQNPSSERARAARSRLWSPPGLGRG